MIKNIGVLLTHYTIYGTDVTNAVNASFIVDIEIAYLLHVYNVIKLTASF